MAKITNHVTSVGDILFMAAARPLKNQRTGKEEYTIKVKLDESVEGTLDVKNHLLEVAEYKVDTKTNRQLSGELILNFSSNFAPEVMGPDGQVWKGKEIPFFDGRKDTGKAAVSYNVIDYGDNKIVRLAGIKIVDLNLAPREESSESLSDIKDVLKNLG